MAQAFWLPWALMGFTMVMGGSPMPDLFGILVGHLYVPLLPAHLLDLFGILVGHLYVPLLGVQIRDIVLGDARHYTRAQ